MMARPRGSRLAAVLLLASIAGGCTSLGERIAEPHSTPMLDAETRDSLDHTAGVRESHMHTRDGVMITYRLIPAAIRGVQYELSRVPGSMKFGMKFGQPSADTSVRGTVIYLHGWSLDASSMLPWALALSEHGYLGISADLRNHGNSARAPAGFGTREAGDVVALVEHLRSTGDLQPPVYLFGVSYGAATALFAEPALRGRISGIVAMETYANTGDGVRDMLAGMLADHGNGFHAGLTHAYMRHRYRAAEIDQAVAEAGQRLRLDLDAVDVSQVLAGSRTCTLLLHGSHDRYIPVTVARSLAKTSPMVRYRELPDENHVSLPLRVDWLAEPIADWLQAAADGCPEVSLPGDPLGVPRPLQRLEQRATRSSLN